MRELFVFVILGLVTMWLIIYFWHTRPCTPTLTLTWKKKKKKISPNIFTLLWITSNECFEVFVEVFKFLSHNKVLGYESEISWIKPLGRRPWLGRTEDVYGASWTSSGRLMCVQVMSCSKGSFSFKLLIMRGLMFIPGASQLFCNLVAKV